MCDIIEDIVLTSILKNSMKLLLTSAGITNDAIANALADLAGRPLTELTIIHIPTAMNTDGGDKSWVIDDLLNLKNRNFKSVDILDIAALPKEVWQERLKAADIISFGGGNEQYLAKVFQELGMKEFLLSVLESKVYMGISAGSMVAGEYLPRNLLHVIYPEEDFGGTLEKPIELYNFSFIPHLNSPWFSNARKEVLDSLQSEFTSTVYTTDDMTAISIVDTTVKIVGDGEYYVYKK